MRLRGRAARIGLLFVAVATGLVGPPVVQAMPPAEGARSAAAYGSRPVVTGLEFPAGFTFTPAGRIVYGERFSGEIRIWNPGNERDRLFFRITNVNSDGERGLLGVDLHPRWPDQPYLFAYATRNGPNGPVNQIVRIRAENGVGVASKVIFSSTAAPATNHHGGRILFGPDGKLYAVVGEAAIPENSQDLTNPRGKVLRMTTRGRVPEDNPFEGSRIFAYGIRNSFGFTFDPRTGRMWQTEAGPECNDEVNVILEGRNYGWGPNETCSGTSPQNTNQDGPDPRLPELWYTPPITPTGVAFCTKCGLGRAARGNLFFGASNTGEIRRVSIVNGQVRRQFLVYDHGDAVLSMEVAPGGGLYFSDTQGIHQIVPA